MSAVLPIALAAGLTLATLRPPRRGTRNDAGVRVDIDVWDSESRTVEGELQDAEGRAISGSSMHLKVGTPKEVKFWLRDEGSYLSHWRVPVRERNPDLVGFVEYLAVPEDLRGRGWATRLYVAAETAAREAWAPEALYLNSVESAVGFWKRMGFVVVDNGKSGSCLIVMRKELLQP